MTECSKSKPHLKYDESVITILSSHYNLTEVQITLETSGDNKPLILLKLLLNNCRKLDKLCVEFTSSQLNNQDLINIFAHNSHSLVQLHLKTIDCDVSDETVEVIVANSPNLIDFDVNHKRIVAKRVFNDRNNVMEELLL